MAYFRVLKLKLQARFIKLVREPGLITGVVLCSWLDGGSLRTWPPLFIHVPVFNNIAIYAFKNHTNGRSRWTVSPRSKARYLTNGIDYNSVAWHYSTFIFHGIRLTLVLTHFCHEYVQLLYPSPLPCAKPSAVFCPNLLLFFPTHFNDFQVPTSAH